MKLKPKTPGVSRVDSGERHHGWRVYGWDRDAKRLVYLAFFGDRKHGGKKRSLEAAEKHAKEHRPPTEPRSKIRPDGLPTGVTIHEKAEGKQIVRARIQVDGVAYSTDYAVGRRTLKEAIAKAKQTRRAYERRIYGKPLPIHTPKENQ